ncbi:hypothetical protein J591_0775 [Acinetobacter baumannii 532279]|uniref:hypothetical protein n=1 Tax=Acinetobacter baumannii TaxID=470 RepID=UPI00044C7FAA|nr:hypothetical protein [Acinetobacter baumannii]EXE88948.1 hypothetical protein J591_0775 [Acinetobacter baumannii 532279]
MNLQSFKKFVEWCYKHIPSILSVLFVSVLFPAVLADYNQRAAISKTAYEVDYKAAKNKTLECQREHNNYLNSLEKNTSSAEFLHKHYSIDQIQQYEYSETYFIFFKGLIETYNKSLKMNDELLSKTQYCYKELDNLYENLAISLALLPKYKKIIDSSDIQILKASKERNLALNAFKQKKGIDIQDYLFKVMISESDEELYKALKGFSFHDLAMLQMNNIEFEQKLYAEKQRQIIALNEMVRDRINDRFHHGIRNYFSSFILNN